MPWGTPNQIVPILAENKIYIASERTFYRVLGEENQLAHRQKSKPKTKRNKPKALCATQPGQILTWDITYLKTTVLGHFFYLYSESLFKTLKYCPYYPDQPFDDIQEARQWMAKFTDWYNNQHRHSSIKYVTPSQRHDGLDIDILAARQQTYEQAKENNPARWSRQTRDWERQSKVWLNPSKDDKIDAEQPMKLVA